MNPIVLAPTSLVRATPTEYIDAAVQAGYDGVGLRLFASPGVDYAAFYPIAGDPAMEREVTAKLRDTNLKVYDILSFYMQPETDIDGMAPALEYGAEIGAQYALVIGDDPDWKRQVDNFGRFCALAAQYGLEASVEAPVTQRHVNRLERALNLIKESGAQNAVICLDPYHFNHVGDTADMIRAEDPRLFPYTQIDDGKADPPPPKGRCAPGEGVVPLADILDALKPNLPLSLEWSTPQGSNYTPAEWAQIAIDKTKTFLDGYYASKSAK
jgi:sugar phosphate isomerase/epimerase